MRTTDDRKDYTLKVRLSDDMRRYIERTAYSEQISMSEYLRQLIEKDMQCK